MAHPSIWTSTLPLDYGGYDTGISRRPLAMAELFKQQGFLTVGFTNCFFLHAFFGYDRGFDTVYPLYDLRRGWQALYSNYFSHYLQQWQTGRLSEQAFTAVALPLFMRALQFFAELSRQQQKLLQTAAIAPLPVLKREFLARVQFFCEETARQIEENGADFFLEQVEFWLTPHLFRQVGVSLPIADSWLKRKLGYRLNRLRDTPFYPLTLAYWSHQGPRDADTALMANGAYVLENVNHWLRQQPPTEKLFLWVALSDIHELYSGRSLWPNPLSRPGVWLERLRRGESQRGSFAYDLAVNYEDALIGQLLANLKRHWGHLDDVLIVICADHGRQWWLDDLCSERTGSETLNFYEELIRVPLIFWHRQLPAQRIEHLCGLLDVAPTLVDLLGWPQVPDFQGQPVYTTAARSRPYLLLEDAGRGPCDLDKPLRITVRTPRYKYIWQPATTDKGERNELYDLDQDRQEVVNLYQVPTYQALGQELKTIAKARSRQLKASLNTAT